MLSVIFFFSREGVLIRRGAVNSTEFFQSFGLDMTLDFVRNEGKMEHRIVQIGKQERIFSVCTQICVCVVPIQSLSSSTIA